MARARVVVQKPYDIDALDRLIAAAAREAASAGRAAS